VSGFCMSVGVGTQAGQTEEPLRAVCGVGRRPQADQPSRRDPLPGKEIRTIDDMIYVLARRFTDETERLRRAERQLRGGVPLDEQGDVVADWAAIKSAVFLVHEPCDIGAGLRPGRRRRVSVRVGQWSAVDSTRSCDRGCSPLTVGSTCIECASIEGRMSSPST
jgi:hypothetical protein